MVPSGSILVKVAGTMGMKVGDPITISSAAGTEVNEIAGFSSIILKYPLKYTHQQGAVIKKLIAGDQNDDLLIEQLATMTTRTATTATSTLQTSEGKDSIIDGADGQSDSSVLGLVMCAGAGGLCCFLALVASMCIIRVKSRAKPETSKEMKNISHGSAQQPTLLESSRSEPPSFNETPGVKAVSCTNAEVSVVQDAPLDGFPESNENLALADVCVGVENTPTNRTLHDERLNQICGADHNEPGEGFVLAV